MNYVCTVCGYEYSQDGELPDGWACPVCGAGKNLSEAKGGGEDEAVGHSTQLIPRNEPQGEYLKEWARLSDDTEGWMKDIHAMAQSGHSIYEPMRTRLSVVSWDDILIAGAQLNPMPLAHDAAVSSKTVIGKKAARPMELQTPLLVSHMSYGALSKEAKLALAKGSAMAGAGMMAIGCQQYRMCGTGHADVHALSVNALFTTSSELSEKTGIENA